MVALSSTVERAATKEEEMKRAAICAFMDGVGGDADPAQLTFV